MSDALTQENCPGQLSSYLTYIEAQCSDRSGRTTRTAALARFLNLASRGQALPCLQRTQETMGSLAGYEVIVVMTNKHRIRTWPGIF